MRAAVVQRTSLWHPGIATSSQSLLVATVQDAPPGCPITAGPATKLWGRGHQSVATMPVAKGRLIWGSAWAIHDPACPATAHQTLTIYYTRVGAGSFPWGPLGSAYPAQATTWMPISGHYQEPTGDVTAGGISFFINQTADLTCTWWIVADQGGIIG